MKKSRPRFREKLRIKRNPWAVDPEDEGRFLNRIKARLLDISQMEDKEAIDEELDVILEEMIIRYSDEIAGNFVKSRYRLVRRLVTFGFAELLNASRVQGIGSMLATSTQCRIRSYYW